MRRRLPPRVIEKLKMRIFDARASVRRATSRLARLMRGGMSYSDAAVNSLYHEVRNAYLNLRPFGRGRAARARRMLGMALQRLGTLSGRGWSGVGQMPLPAPIMPGGAPMGPMTAMGPVIVPQRAAPASPAGRGLAELRQVFQLLIGARRLLR